jgi:hypothetical protein
MARPLGRDGCRVFCFSQFGNSSESVLNSADLSSKHSQKKCRVHDWGSCTREKALLLGSTHGDLGQLKSRAETLSA